MRDRDDEMIRQALLDAVSAEFDEAMAQRPEEVSFSDEFLAWEEEFLRDPIQQTKKQYRKQRMRKAPRLWKAACFAVVILLSLGVGMFSGPYIATTALRELGSDAPRTVYSYEIGIQLDGPQGCVYTSEGIGTNDSIRTLWYWYQNDSESDCIIHLYQRSWWKDEIVSRMTVPAGEEAFETYPAPGDHEYYVRVTCLDGSGSYVDGKLRIEPYE